MQPSADGQDQTDDELAEITGEEERCLGRVQKHLAAQKIATLSQVDYDKDLLALRDQIAEARLEDVPPLIEEMERLTEVALGRASYSAPSGCFRHYEMMQFWCKRQFPSLRFRYTGCHESPSMIADFFIEAVTNALIEQKREHVATELGVIGAAAQDVGGCIEETFQLTLSHAPGWPNHDGRF